MGSMDLPRDHDGRRRPSRCSTYGLRDPYKNITEVSRDVLESLASALEARATEAKVAGIRDRLLKAALEHVGSSGSTVIVDVGCGIGVISRAMSAMPGVSKVI